MSFAELLLHCKFTFLYWRHTLVLNGDFIISVAMFIFCIYEPFIGFFSISFLLCLTNLEWLILTIFEYKYVDKSFKNKVNFGQFKIL